MKVLFVCSGNKSNGLPGTVVQNQADSLGKFGIEIEFFVITKKGVKGYLKSINPLIKNYAKINTQ